MILFFFGGHTSVSDTAKTLELFINTYDVPYQDISSHVRERAKGQWVYWYMGSPRESMVDMVEGRICSFQDVSSMIFTSYVQVSKVFSAAGWGFP